MAPAAPKSTIQEFSVSRYENVWKVDDDGIGPATVVSAPIWMSEMYSHLCGNISKSGDTLKQIRKADLDPESLLPGYVKIYGVLVKEQNVLYNQLTEQSVEWLMNTSREAFARIKIAGNQFVSQIELASKFVGLEPEQQSTGVGKLLLEILESQSIKNMQQMSRISNYLGQRETLIAGLMKRLKSGKTEMASLTLERDELIKNAHPEAERRKTQELLDLHDKCKAKELKSIWDKLSTLHETVERELKGNVSNERRLLLKQLIKEVKTSVRSASTSNVLIEADEAIVTIPELEAEDEDVEDVVRSNHGNMKSPAPPPPSKPDSDPWDGGSSDESDHGGSRNEYGGKSLYPSHTPPPPSDPWVGQGDAIGSSLGRKKPPINKPKTYGGDRNASLSYRQWFTVLEDYLNYHQASYENDRDKITIVGSHMDGKARDWFDSRKRQMRDLHVNDNFISFQKAMDARFKTDKEDHVNLRKMKKVIYNNDVQAYIDSLEHLNLKVGLSGLAWRDILKNGLPDEISYRLSLTQGGEPQEDDSLIQSIREHGLAHERRLDEKKLRGDAMIPSSSSKSKKRKRENHDSTEMSTPQKQKENHSGENLINTRVPKGKGEPVFATTDKEAAHEGIPQTLVDKRFKQGDCTRCGLNNHRWMYCRKEAIVSSARKLKKAAAAQKAQHSIKENPEPESSTDKKASAVKAVKLPFPRRFAVRGPVVDSDGSREIMAHLNMQAGISSSSLSKSMNETSSSRSRVYDIHSEDEE